jgi:hypothetical protein
VLGETMQEAHNKKERLDRAMAENLEPRLAQLSFLSGIDFSRFDLDAPLPDIQTNASRSLTTLYTYGTGARTLREALSNPASGGVDFVGTPDSVAADMGEAIAEIGGDGFMITEGLTRRTIGEITDGPAPDALTLQPCPVPRQSARILSRAGGQRPRASSVVGATGTDRDSVLSLISLVGAARHGACGIVSQTISKRL